MPLKDERYKLRKVPRKDLYWVVDSAGKHYSKEGLPKEKAREQQKALYAAESRKQGGVREAPGLSAAQAHVQNVLQIVNRGKPGVVIPDTGKPYAVKPESGPTAEMPSDGGDPFPSRTPKEILLKDFPYGLPTREKGMKPGEYDALKEKGLAPKKESTAKEIPNPAAALSEEAKGYMGDFMAKGELEEYDKIDGMIYALASLAEGLRSSSSSSSSNAAAGGAEPPLERYNKYLSYLMTKNKDVFQALQQDRGLNFERVMKSVKPNTAAAARESFLDMIHTLEKRLKDKHLPKAELRFPGNPLGAGRKSDCKCGGNKQGEALAELYSGGGFVDMFNKITSKAKEVVQRVVGVAQKGMRQDLPPKAREILRKYGNAYIMGINIRRDPIQSTLNTALNAITLGSWDRMKRVLNYDKLFHLGLELDVRRANRTERLLLEKNEVINLGPLKARDDDTEMMRVDMQGKQLTLNQFIENARNQMGDKFIPYDPFYNNCQDFILSVLRANGLATENEATFIKQPIEKLIKGIPDFAPAVAKAVTDLGGYANNILEGEGLRGGLTEEQKAFRAKRDAENARRKAEQDKLYKENPAIKAAAIERDRRLRSPEYKAEQAAKRAQEGAIKKAEVEGFQARQQQVKEYNEEMRRRRESGFAPIVDALVKAGDIGVKYIAPAVGVPKVVTEAYKAFAPPGSEFYQGSGPMGSSVRRINKGMKGKLAPLAVKVAENIIENRGNPVGLIADLAATASGGKRHAGATHRQAVLRRLKLADKPHSLAALAKASKVPQSILQEVYNRGIGAYKTQPQSVRLKGSFVKNVKAPMSAKLSKEQWALARVYSFLNGNPEHDNDLRANRQLSGEGRAVRKLRGGADNNPTPSPPPAPVVTGMDLLMWLDQTARDEGVYELPEDDEDYDPTPIVSEWAQENWPQLQVAARQHFNTTAQAIRNAAEEAANEYEYSWGWMSPDDEVGDEEDEEERKLLNDLQQELQESLGSSSNVRSTGGRKSAPVIKMKKADFVKEHKKLIGLLGKVAKEGKEQAAELKRVTGRGRLVGAGRFDQIVFEAADKFRDHVDGFDIPKNVQDQIYAALRELETDAYSDISKLSRRKANPRMSELLRKRRKYEIAQEFIYTTIEDLEELGLGEGLDDLMEPLINELDELYDTIHAKLAPYTESTDISEAEDSKAPDRIIRPRDPEDEDGDEDQGSSSNSASSSSNVASSGYGRKKRFTGGAKKKDDADDELARIFGRMGMSDSEEEDGVLPSFGVAAPRAETNMEKMLASRKSVSPPRSNAAAAPAAVGAPVALVKPVAKKAAPKGVTAAPGKLKTKRAAASDSEEDKSASNKKTGKGRAAAVEFVALEPSKAKGKKWTVRLRAGGKNRVVHFGAAGAEDFTISKDNKRKALYIQRHKARENWTKAGVLTPGFWAKHLLWNKPDLQASLAATRARFNL